MVIVGTGVAGLYTALCLPDHLKITCITKDKVENCDSYLAQGGVCTLPNEDGYESFLQDTLRAGHFENNIKSVEIMIKSAPAVMSDLESFGVAFDKDKNGKFSYTREAAHSESRILHHQDLTGKEITSKLYQAILQCKNITVLEYADMLDIIEKDKACCGIVMKFGNEIQFLFAKTVVLATGGIGGLFESTTNFSHIKGDGLGVALCHGITVQDISYIQVHPTSFFTKKPGRRFLISESVRGEGAFLWNGKGERFADELLPRDQLTNAIWQEMEKTQVDHVFLSVAHFPKGKFKTRFPNIYAYCLQEGIDAEKEPIPVAPSQHYFMGGIQTDTEGQTSMANLYAVGEAGCNGVHGANRLASNSLLESLVFAGRAAHTIAQKIDTLGNMQTELTAESYQAVDYRDKILSEIERRDRDFYAKCRRYGLIR